MRVVELGLLGLKFDGISVKLTSVSSCDRAGTLQSASSASRLVAANPLLRVSLRLISSDMGSPPSHTDRSHPVSYLHGRRNRQGGPSRVVCIHMVPQSRLK